MATRTKEIERRERERRSCMTSTRHQKLFVKEMAIDKDPTCHRKIQEKPFDSRSLYPRLSARIRVCIVLFSCASVRQRVAFFEKIYAP